MNKLIISLLLVITIAVPLFFDGHLYSVFDLSKITLLYILTFLLAGVWAVRGNLPQVNPLTYPILAVLISTVISTVLAVSPYISLMGTYKRYGGLLTLIVYMVLFFAVTEFVTKQKIATFINAAILTSSVAACYGIFQSLGLDPYHWTTDFGWGLRASAAFGHPMYLGAYLAMALMLVLYGILQRRWWLYPVGGLLMYALFLSKTRSAFIALVVAMIYFFVLYRKQISYKLIGTVVVVIICLSIFIPNSPVKRFAHDLKDWKPSGTIAERFKIGMTTLDIVRDNPIVGIGPDCLAMVYPTYYELRYETKCTSVTNRAHNSILEVLVTQGIVGLLAWLCVVVIYFRMVIRNRNDLLVVALSSAVVAYMVQSLFSPPGTGITPLFWILIAMTIIACRNKVWYFDHRDIERDW